MTGDAVAMMIQRRAADAGYTPAQVDLSGVPTPLCRWPTGKRLPQRMTPH